VLLVSSELDEILALSDRIAVMYKGRIMDIVDANKVSKEHLGLLMAGIHPSETATAQSSSTEKVF
jgi:simple sugar transport system ATP-binding protein